MTPTLLLFLLAVLGVAANSTDVQDIPKTTPKADLSGSLLQCEEGQSLSCLKAAAAGLVPVLAVPRRLVLWPGLAVTAGGFQVDPPPAQPAQLDTYLLSGLRGFVSSLALRLKVLDPELGQRLAKFSRTFADTAQPEAKDDATGRRKKVNNALLLGGLLSGGMMLALGMAAISAMAGKALMMSLLSLGISMLSRNGNGNGGNGGGGGHEKTTYEIIHTVPSHDEYSHHRAGDVTHEGYHVVRGQ